MDTVPTRSDALLLARIEALQIGPADAALSYVRRLARENAWPLQFAERVLQEYRRYLYLVYCSGVEVTPSDEVDQAWHLHLTYTRSYWHDLCRSILGFELHHNPTRGGAQEQQRFERQYRDTLALYAEVFGHQPPTDIWPPVAQRFAAVEDFVRVNLKHKWVLAKPGKTLDKMIALVVLPLLLVACTENLGDRDIWFWLKVALGVYILYILLKWLRSMGGGGSSGGGSGCGGCGGCGG